MNMLQQAVLAVLTSASVLAASLDPPGETAFLETALGNLMSLVHSGQIDLTTLIAKLTCEPARIIGDRYGKLGTLTIGAPADVTLFDPDAEWVVDTTAFASKGKNTPLASSVLRGKVMATISQGEPVYEDTLITVKES